MNVQVFVKKKYGAPFALASVVNEHLYKYCEKYGVPIAKDGGYTQCTLKKNAILKATNSRQKKI